MKKLNKYLAYTKYYMLNVLLTYYILLPVVILLLLLVKLKEMLTEMYYELEDSVVTQGELNKKALSILKERFKGNT